MMPTYETLWDMVEPSINRRELAGSIVKDEIARAHLTTNKAADACHVAPSTISKVTAGQESVSDLTLRSIEGGLGLPTRFLSYVIAGDTERISRLPSADKSEAGIREDLRAYTLDALAEINTPDQRRHFS